MWMRYIENNFFIPLFTKFSIHGEQNYNILHANDKIYRFSWHYENKPAISNGSKADWDTVLYRFFFLCGTLGQN